MTTKTLQVGPVSVVFDRAGLGPKAEVAVRTVAGLAAMAGVVLTVWALVSPSCPSIVSKVVFFFVLGRAFSAGFHGCLRD